MKAGEVAKVNLLLEFARGPLKSTWQQDFLFSEVKVMLVEHLLDVVFLLFHDPVMQLRTVPAAAIEASLKTSGRSGLARGAVSRQLGKVGASLLLPNAKHPSFMHLLAQASKDEVGLAERWFGLLCDWMVSEHPHWENVYLRLGGWPEHLYPLAEVLEAYAWRLERARKVDVLLSSLRDLKDRLEGADRTLTQEVIEVLQDVSVRSLPEEYHRALKQLR